MRICYLCKTLLKKNEGTLHIISNLPNNSKKRLICNSCHVRFHEDFLNINDYTLKYLNKLKENYDVNFQRK